MTTRYRYERLTSIVVYATTIYGSHILFLFIWQKTYQKLFDEEGYENSILIFRAFRIRFSKSFQFLFGLNDRKRYGNIYYHHEQDLFSIHTATRFYNYFTVFLYLYFSFFSQDAYSFSNTISTQLAFALRAFLMNDASPSFGKHYHSVNVRFLFIITHTRYST